MSFFAWFKICIHCSVLCVSFCNLPFLLNIIHGDLFTLLLGALLDSFYLQCVVHYMKILPFIDSPVDRRGSLFWCLLSQAVLQWTCHFCAYTCEVFRAVFFSDGVVTILWGMNSNQWVAITLEKNLNRIEYIGKYQNMLSMVRGVTISLNLFQWRGDRVYFDHPITI